MIYTAHCNSPIGPLFLAEEDGALTGLWMDGQKYFLGALAREPMEERPTPVLLQTVQWLERYFAGQRPPADSIPLAPRGRPFRQEVWSILRDIPYGRLTTYGAIARTLADRHNRPSMSAQAVGGAVGHNPISILIPCHRVVGSDGSLTGYAGGLEKKIQLLALEGIPADTLRIPRKGTAL